MAKSGTHCIFFLYPEGYVEIFFALWNWKSNVRLRDSFSYLNQSSGDIDRLPFSLHALILEDSCIAAVICWVKYTGFETERKIRDEIYPF